VEYAASQTQELPNNDIILREKFWRLGNFSCHKIFQNSSRNSFFQLKKGSEWRLHNSIWRSKGCWITSEATALLKSWSLGFKEKIVKYCVKFLTNFRNNLLEP
jgi:hypothetical protein